MVFRTTISVTPHSSIHNAISREAALELTDYSTVDRPYQTSQAIGGVDHASHAICVLM